MGGGGQGRERGGWLGNPCGLVGKCGERASSGFKGESSIKKCRLNGRVRSKNKRVRHGWGFCVGPHVRDNMADSSDNHISPPYMGLILVNPLNTLGRTREE